MTLGTILYVSVLLINSLAILNEERFLARIGWSSSQLQPGAGGFQQPYEQPGFAGGQVDIGFKGRLITLISAVRTLMRIPLIGINLLIILYELTLGG
ncbi:Yos1-like protein [Gloeophyllum trabeum ATCC 11539]|uniref:Yos1-like protein n=1 Tax=Gloeophyllum trabeum (strain ATCC 11539 / FP-39264 / Madison 617) TaxID=670483 RepID=S7QHF3_GLOTA|nr:Yos1-like protein [Gloeophyllum trabeum ATCC 11539]EPQ59231.1 Yos1-like protein [Gloeophyllum trabeum ATCC 11539]